MKCGTYSIISNTVYLTHCCPITDFNSYATFDVNSGDNCKPSSTFEEDIPRETAGMTELWNIGMDTPMHSNLFEVSLTIVPQGTLQRNTHRIHHGIPFRF